MSYSFRLSDGSMATVENRFANRVRVQITHTDTFEIDVNERKVVAQEVRLPVDTWRREVVEHLVFEGNPAGEVGRDFMRRVRASGPTPAAKRVAHLTRSQLDEIAATHRLGGNSAVAQRFRIVLREAQRRIRAARDAGLLERQGRGRPKRERRRLDQ